MTSPTGKQSRFNPFNGLLWLLFLMTAGYLLLWPPLEGFWAKHYWKEVPCYAPASTAQYFFEVNGKKYVSTRKDLWTVMKASPFPATVGTPIMGPNAVCYVRENASGLPALAVLSPQAPPTADQLFSRMAILVMVLATVLIMTWRVRKAASVRPVAKETGTA